MVTSGAQGHLRLSLDRRDTDTVNWLLLPEDERAFIRYLADERGLVPLGETPSADEHLGRGADDLPEQVHLGSPVSEFAFWASDIGPIERLGSAPEPTDPKARVMRQLNVELTSEWRSLIDPERTPVIRYHRTSQNRNGCLNPGLLSAQARPIRQQPKALVSLLRSIERWLRSDGRRLNPFDHCPTRPSRQGRAA